MGINYKDARMEFRLNKKLKQEVMKRADELNMPTGDYIIQCLMQNRIINLEGIRDVLNQLVKIGANVNQIASKANSISYISKDEVAKTQDLMEKCFRVVENFIEHNSKIINENTSFTDINTKLILEKISALEEKIGSV